MALRVPLHRFVIALVLAVVLAAPAAAQATQTVPPDHPVYSFIDRLLALRLADTVLAGQRMLSRREVGRILAEARARGATDTSWIGRRLSEFTEVFPSDLERAPMMGLVEGELTAADSPPRGIAPDANGVISVVVNPMLANRLGRPYIDGTTASAIAGGSLPIAPWLVVDGSFRYSLFAAQGTSANDDGQVERLYARALWRNLAVLAGRDHIFLGQGHSAGLMASLNPRAIDQVRLSADRPFVMPWLLRYIGPTQATILLGDLGSRQFFPHSSFLAYKVSVRPHRAFELGVGLTEIVGGEGAPGGTFTEKVQDAFPLLDALFLHRNLLFSNKLVGVDLRYTIPRTRGLQFHAEGAFDDFDLRRVKSVFTEDAGYVWGLTATCFAECGPVRASAEYHVTGVRYYTHGTFQSGYTIDDQFIGDPLGPRGKAGYGRLDADAGKNSWRLDLAYESRSGHKWGSVTTTPDDSDFRLIVIETHPTERRWRSMASLRRGLPNSAITYRAGVGIERVENFAHIDDTWRTNWMARFAVEYSPVRFKR